MPRHRNSSKIRAHQARMHSKPVKNYGPGGDRIWNKGARYIDVNAPHCAADLTEPQTQTEAQQAEAQQAEADREAYEEETIVCQECGQRWSYMMLSEPFCGNCGSGNLFDESKGEYI